MQGFADWTTLTKRGTNRIAKHKTTFFIYNPNNVRTKAKIVRPALLNLEEDKF
jgi:hypothetical protein